MGPYGSENFKTLPLLQIASENSAKVWELSDAICRRGSVFEIFTPIGSHVNENEKYS